MGNAQSDHAMTNVRAARIALSNKPERRERAAIL
jgi:hypothetical protein